MSNGIVDWFSEKETVSNSGNSSDTPSDGSDASNNSTDKSFVGFTTEPWYFNNNYVIDTSKYILYNGSYYFPVSGYRTVEDAWFIKTDSMLNPNSFYVAGCNSLFYMVVSWGESEVDICIARKKCVPLHI